MILIFLLSGFVNYRSENLFLFNEWLEEDDIEYQ